MGARILGLILLLAGVCRADDAAPRPVLGPGATRDEVIEAYGWPNGQSRLGKKEIFTYAQGRVELSDGIVERLDFSPGIPWQKPKPRPMGPTAITAKAPVAKVAKPVVLDPWITDFPQASAEAARRSVPILALFTGSDWSPLSQRLQAEVATRPDFVDAVEDRYVLLKLDYPTHTRLAPALHHQNHELRVRYGVKSYPSLLILNADGQELARVNLHKTRPPMPYHAQVLAAIDEAEASPMAVGDLPPPPPTTAVASAPEAAPVLTRSWIFGSVLAVVLAGWLAYRRRRPPARAVKPARASPLPTPAEMSGWSHERVRDVAASLFEYEGARLKKRPTESGADLVLLHPDGERPKVLVRCQAAGAGLASGRSVRDLFGAMVMERVDNAWYVSTGGFTQEARLFAAERGIVLLGGEELLLRLGALSPMALLRIVEAQR